MAEIELLPETVELLEQGSPAAALSAHQQTAKACRNCEHFEPPASGSRCGQCRINPPIAALVPVPAKLGPNGIQAIADWPPVLPNQWCSKFEPKPERVQ